MIILGESLATKTLIGISESSECTFVDVFKIMQLECLL